MEIIQNRDAQFMLLAGFIIAIGLVITTVLLNSIIFEGNMAVEGGGELSKNEIVNMMQITEDEIKAAYRNVTPGASNENAIYNFTKQMNNFSANLPKIFALHGGAMNISWDIENWNSTRYANFTENGMPAGSANWTVIEGVNVSSVDIFQFSNVTKLAGKNFKIEARKSSGFVWSIEFNDTHYIVTNLTNTTNGTTPLPNSIDLLSTNYYFKESASPGPVSIHIINGNNSYGKFWIQGIANGKIFYRERHFVLNATPSFSTNRMKVNIMIPVSVPW